MSSRLYDETRSQDVLDRIKKGEKLNIVDVREADEWESGHIAGAKHIPLGQMGRMMNEIDPKQETILICRSGGRSSMACDHLASMGYKVVNMRGGMMSWPGEVVYGK